jgi:Protein required for attachment to host cells
MKHLCLVIADATRARIFTYEQLLDPSGPREQLREERDLIDPEHLKHEGDMFSNAGGGDHAGVHGFGFDDHRQAHLEDLAAKFAARVVGEAEQVLASQGYRELVVIASPKMLGWIRPKLDAVRRTVKVTELDRDLTNLTLGNLREQLTALDVLPPRLNEQPQVSRR